MRWLAILVLVACGHPATPREDPKKPPPQVSMLASLPKPAAVDTARFTSVIVCDRCHTPGEKQMRGPKGEDISPVGEIRAGMMFMAARDPYYLAAVRRELIANPKGKPEIESTCLRCHAPVGFAENPALTLDDVLAGKGDAPDLARDGVGCLGCHGLDPAKLGDESTFTGKHAFRSDRIAYGVLAKPEGEAMIQMSKTTPKQGDHLTRSELCASCHTVLVKALDREGKPTGEEIPEQTTFLEWRSSYFGQQSSSSSTCQGCHMSPSADHEISDGTQIITPMSTRPVDAPPRSYKRHTLRGGNSYLLRQLADHVDWLDTKVEAAQLRAAADGTDAFMRTAAEIQFGEPRRMRDGLTPMDPMRLPIEVINKTGHKLPTGYPTRRVWLHVVVKSATGEVLLDSGGHKGGAIVDREGNRLDGAGVIFPHRTEIHDSIAPVVWEAVPVDAQGRRTHLLLGTSRIVKDNRILPRGFGIIVENPSDRTRTRPIGVDGDNDFLDTTGRGHAVVDLVVPTGGKRIEVELLYQAIPPETIDSYSPTDSKEAARFLSIVAAPPQPVRIAEAQRSL